MGAAAEPRRAGDDPESYIADLDVRLGCTGGSRIFPRSVEMEGLPPS